MFYHGKTEQGRKVPTKKTKYEAVEVLKVYFHVIALLLCVSNNSVESMSLQQNTIDILRPAVKHFMPLCLVMPQWVSKAAYRDQQQQHHQSIKEPESQPASAKKLKRYNCFLLQQLLLNISHYVQEVLIINFLCLSLNEVKHSSDKR